MAGLLESKRGAIVERWTGLALQDYPQDSAPFLSQEKDRFRNPVGHLTRESLKTLFDALLARRPTEEIRAALDGIVRVRAVQELSPSRALGFVFLLKRAVQEELGEAAIDPVARVDLAELHDGVDRLALQAFELFMECKERIYDLRVREMKRRTSTLLKRFGDPAPDGPAAGRANT